MCEVKFNKSEHGCNVIRCCACPQAFGRACNGYNMSSCLDNTVDLYGTFCSVLYGSLAHQTCSYNPRPGTFRGKCAAWRPGSGGGTIKPQCRCLGRWSSTKGQKPTSPWNVQPSGQGIASMGSLSLCLSSLACTRIVRTKRSWAHRFLLKCPSDASPVVDVPSSDLIDAKY